MCVEKIRYFSCGCKKSQGFNQCIARQGTTFKCAPMVKERLPDSSHMCIAHMVKPGKDEMRRP
ncbi:hypothetical protein M438DRAFT_265201 [Aureobasidium pullulans EXF-150]|uniref:Uncharacterized protein n=1 Tax=Aureobasidium pullulans EXF-150 TaxID=1043002 RepID=A0A074YQ74_AURPU|nr:uncharacterized protein M438DRAFT_265201 [Aureobasidium pullulans EXF-150]KEQ88986.1 hypothetical protein M438DRAFT_265201 [Aureobasidium pullulans EXF-150]